MTLHLVSWMMALWGLRLLWARLRRPSSYKLYFWRKEEELRNIDWPLVSIIVPTRNDSARLHETLSTLSHLDYPNKEIIVVDDCSEERIDLNHTEFKDIKLVEGQPKPDGWNGKQWACHQGARQAQGDFLLFTTLDTLHMPESLKSAVSYSLSHRIDLLTALPFIQTKQTWQRLLGPFYVMVLSLAAPFERNFEDRRYATGQYLLIRRKHYEETGGHQGLRRCIKAESPLAQRSIASGGCLATFEGPVLYKVRSEVSFNSFTESIVRSFRSGLVEVSAYKVFELVCIFKAITGNFFFSPHFLGVILMILSMRLLLRRQSAIGRFSVAGPILFPLSVFYLFFVVGKAFIDQARKKEVKWRGRKYNF